MIKGEGSAASMSCISLCHNKRSSLLKKSTDEFLRMRNTMVCYQDVLHLHHETFDQANIPPRNAQNSGNSLFIRKIVGRGLHSMTPALFQKIARLLVGQRLHFMREANPQVELWSSHQTLFQAW